MKTNFPDNALQVFVQVPHATELAQADESWRQNFRVAHVQAMENPIKAVAGLMAEMRGGVTQETTDRIGRLYQHLGAMGRDFIMDSDANAHPRVCAVKTAEYVHRVMSVLVDELRMAAIEESKRSQNPQPTQRTTTDGDKKPARRIRRP